MRYFKKAAVIGALTDSIHTIKIAKRKGIYIYAIDGNPKADGFLEANDTFVCDISNINKIKEIINKIKLDFILPVPVGRYLYTTACMNECFNLKGIKRKFTKISVDKYEFHRFLNKNNLRNIKSILISHYEKIENSYNISFPAIIKPRYGSGCRDVFYIVNNDELINAFEQIKDSQEDFVFEEAVEGDEYGVDAAVINGNVYITLIRKKLVTSLPKKQAVGYIALSPNIETDKKIIEIITYMIKRVCSTIKYNNCIIHTDVIVNDNDVFVIEISPRPSGHYLHNVFVPFVSGRVLSK